MAIHKLRSFLLSLVTVFIIFLASAAIIAYGRGYRFNPKETSLVPTGLISATSDPIGAQVFIDGKLKTATNNSFNISPGWYTVRIAKESYLPWEKKVRVQGEVVTRADAVLFRANPSLSPITSVGIENPLLSPDGSKIAYTVPLAKDHDGTKTGLWVYELTEGPLGRNRDPQHIGLPDDSFNFSTATIVWSPDSTQLLVKGVFQTRLYDLKSSKGYADISDSLTATLTEWNDDRLAKEKQKLSAFPPDIVKVASASSKIISFSPDESKLLYEATASAILPLVINPPLIGSNSTAEDRSIKPGKLYVYDIKEDQNYFLLDKKELPHPSPTPKPKNAKPTATQELIDTLATPVPRYILWLPTNRHFVLMLDGKIDILEYDRTNWVTVYAGPFTDGFVSPWPNGSRIVILTNLNPQASTLPNLYTVNFR